MSLRHVLLTVLAQNEASGYDIRGEFDAALGYFWQATHQQVYRELAQLEGEGLIRHRVEAQSGKPDRKVYQLTRQGQAALDEWLAAPMLPARRSNDELMVRLLASAITGSGAWREEMQRQRALHRARLEEFEAIERQHYSPQARAHMPTDLQLVYLSLRRAIRTESSWLAWADEVEQTLCRPAGKGARRRR